MVDLTEQITIFVSSVDENKLKRCVDALNKQDCKFSGPYIIRNIHPMSVAFQKMIDECKTPFYYQADEDMELDPDTISRGYKDMVAQNSQTALLCYPLWDTHMNRIITGLKIYRHEVIKKYPYDLNAPSCEMDQVQRLQRDGYKAVTIWRNPGKPRDPNAPELVGKHVVEDKDVKHRYSNLGFKYSKFPWMGWLATEFRFLCQDPRAAAHFLYGIGKGQEGEKDFTKYDKDPTSDAIDSCFLEESLSVQEIAFGVSDPSIMQRIFALSFPAEPSGIILNAENLHDLIIDQKEIPDVWVRVKTCSDKEHQNLINAKLSGLFPKIKVYVEAFPRISQKKADLFRKDFPDFLLVAPIGKNPSKRRLEASRYNQCLITFAGNNKKIGFLFEKNLTTNIISLYRLQ